MRFIKKNPVTLAETIQNLRRLMILNSQPATKFFFTTHYGILVQYSLS
jgi:hypothetical protein